MSCEAGVQIRNEGALLPHFLFVRFDAAPVYHRAAVIVQNVEVNSRLYHRAVCGRAVPAVGTFCYIVAVAVEYRKAAALHEHVVVAFAGERCEDCREFHNHIVGE